MVERVEQHAAAAERDLLLGAVHARDPGRLAREQLGREVAERRHDLRLDQLDLAEEVALAGLDLVRSRVAVARRPALEHVGDVDVTALEPDPGEQLVEQLAGLADERVALLVLVEAGRLADEHQVGLRVADAEDDLRAALREAAARAARDLARERLELGQRLAQCRSHRNRRSSHRRDPPKLGCSAVPCVAKTENCLRTFAEAQSGQSGSSPFRTSSSKCDSHSMQTYS